MKPIYLEPDQIPAALSVGLGYNGKKFKAYVTDTVTCGGMQWDEGGRSTYRAVNLETRASQPITDRRPWPENMKLPPAITLQPGQAIVEHAIVRGKDAGLTFYIHPDNAPALLPQSDDVPRDVVIVCEFTAALKNTYGGRTNIRFHEARRQYGITAERWETAKADAIARGYLRKNGSITPTGRNIRNSEIRAS